MLQLLHRAHHVQRIAIAVIGIHQQAQVADAHDAPHLIRKIRQRQQNKIRRRQRGVRRHRPRQNTQLVTHALGNTGRQGVIDAGRGQALSAVENGAETFTLFGVAQMAQNFLLDDFYIDAVSRGRNVSSKTPLRKMQRC